jgi:outer membrane scaffolding protein for murein synthesis (MipA/OmpV family)
VPFFGGHKAALFWITMCMRFISVFLIVMFSNMESDASESISLGIVSTDSDDSYGRRSFGVMPYIRYESDYFKVSGTKAWFYPFKKNEPIIFSVFSSYNIGDGYSGSDKSSLDGMNSKHETLWVGGQVSTTLPFGKFDLALQDDVMNIANGSIASISWGVAEESGKFLFGSKVTYQIVDSNVGNYYYGVTEEESNSNRNSYSLSDSTSLDLALYSSYDFTSFFVMSALFEVSHLDSEVSKSPIVEREFPWKLSVFSLYRY